MLTICWAAKGGSGTTVYAAATALASPQRTLLIDLCGDVAPVLGLPEADGPGLHDWLRSESPGRRLGALEVAIATGLDVIPAGRRAPDASAERWRHLADHLRSDERTVIVDAGSGRPPAALLAAADHRLLVTRACYLSLRHALADGTVPTGVVLVEEPGRALKPPDIESSIGAPVVSTVLLDPAIARAVDAGLLSSRLPRSWRRQLQVAA